MKTTVAFVIVAVLAGACAASHFGAPDWEKYIDVNANVVLPGQPATPVVQQQAGYITVDPAHNGKYFFWAQNAITDTDSTPVVLWMTGGPGCSSELAAVFESGMWRVNADGKTLGYNNYTWSNAANMVYIDQPFGVGYSTSDSAVKITDEAEVAKYVFLFLEGYFKKFPQFAGRDFYVTGESYGGRYVPSVSAYVLKMQKAGNAPWLGKFKGVEIGNGWLNAVDQFIGYIDQASPKSTDPSCAPGGAKGPIAECGGLGWISSTQTKVLGAATKECEKMISEGHVSTGDGVCEGIYQDILSNAAKVLGYQPNMYHYTTACHGPLCYDFTPETDYFNLPAVQSALNVAPTSWEICATVDITVVDRDNSSVPDMLYILDSNVPLVHMNGILDTICNEYGVYNVLQNMGWEHQAAWNALPFTPWTVGGSVAGSLKSANGLSFIRVDNGGHMVPHDVPEAALAVFTAFLNGQVPS